MTIVWAAGRAILWLLLGVAGSLAIMIVATQVLDRRGYPQLQGARIFTDLWIAAMCRRGARPKPAKHLRSGTGTFATRRI